MARLFRPVTRMISSRPEATASSTTYWMVGLSTSGNISLGWAFVAGRKRVPKPAAGKTALRTFIILIDLIRNTNCLGCRFTSKRRAVITQHSPANDLQRHTALLHQAIVKFP